MGIAELVGERIVTLEEKPAAPRSNLACVGVWMLGPQAVGRVRARPAWNAKGEADLTATVAALLAEGRPVGGSRLRGRWLDTGSIAGLLNTQAALLAELPAPAAAAPPGCELAGAVVLGVDAIVAASRLTGPVLVGAGARVEGCTLGPNAVVGAGAVLRGVTLRNALVAPGAHLSGCAHDDVVVTTDGTVAAAS
jgi:glucose-1-phosphate thymidylyltransferase